MSAYDDAVAYLDAEVHPRCDYEIYSDMRDIVDEMGAENAGLWDLCDRYKAENAILKERIIELEYERMMMFLELAGEWIRAKRRELGAEA